MKKKSKLIHCNRKKWGAVKTLHNSQFAHWISNSFEQSFCETAKRAGTGWSLVFMSEKELKCSPQRTKVRAHISPQPDIVSWEAQRRRRRESCNRKLTNTWSQEDWIGLHTCVAAVELSEGTDEVGLVREKLLPQDFQGRALSSANTGDEMLTI